MFSKQTTRPWRRGNTSGLNRLGKSLICWMTLSCRGFHNCFFLLSCRLQNTASHYSVHHNNVLLFWHRKPKLSASLWNLNASALWAPYKTHCFHNYSGKKIFLTSYNIHRKRRGLWRVCLCFLKAVNVVIFHSGSIQVVRYMADIHSPCSFVTPAHLVKSVEGIGESVNIMFNSDRMHRSRWIMH